jgi:hypothetical protein
VKLNWKVVVKVSVGPIVTLADTWEYRIPLPLEALAVLALPSQKSQNSLWVPVASHAEKNVATDATAPRNDVLDAAFLVTSVPRVVSHEAGAVGSDPMAT